MSNQHPEIRALLRQVRRRWRLWCGLRALTRASIAAAVMFLAALIAYLLLSPAGLLIVALAGIAIAGALVFSACVFWPLRRRPSDPQVARFIEERCPELEDRLASAVAFAAQPSAAETPLAAPMFEDTAARIRRIDVDTTVSRRALKAAAWSAAAALAALIAVMIAGRHPAEYALDVASIYAFPSRVGLQIDPGHAKVIAGQPLKVNARITGARTGGRPTLKFGGPARWRAAEMQPGARDNEFSFTFDAITDPFTYAVSTGKVASPAYVVTVLHAPHVARIDLRYEYPRAFGLAPRVEQDGGDIYAPAGTAVTLRIESDKPVARGEIAMADGTRQPLVSRGPNLLEGEVTIVEDGSYRVALADHEGLRNAGDTEYFIRMLDDRPPDVRVLRPAGDRQVTRLEEVTIEARAEDDYGIQNFDLVYSVRGGAEKVVPFRGVRGQPAVEASYTLQLEDLQIEPGDFVSYYARARDVSRGKRSSESRSDIFFLEVKPYEAEFAAAQSSSMMGGSDNPGLDGLVAAQKEIIIATWKLNRRSRGQTKSEQDIRSIARAQTELKQRAEQAAQSQQGSFRDPRRRRLRPTDPIPPPGQPTETEPLGLAVQAMGRAETELQALKTPEAIPHEMEAYNQLLRAQASVKRQQVATGRSNSGSAGSNRQTADLSTLFDEELKRQQGTQYETPNSTEQRDDASKSEALEKVRELARRQNELGQQQQDLARQRAQMTADELKRQLERLTREQSELRRQAEELSRQLGQSSSQSGKSGAGSASADGKRMQDISEEMQNAASQLRRQDPAEASNRSGRALEKLKELERRLQGSQPSDRKRALGDLQLEARQLADAQRQISSELGQLQKSGDGQKTADARRRLAGEKDRVADRVDRLQSAVKQLANTPSAEPAKEDRAALAEAAGELQRQRLAERMRQSAAKMRGAAAQPDKREMAFPTDKGGKADQNVPDSAKSNAKAGAAGERDEAAGNETMPQPQAEQELARALDRVADKLGAAAGGQDAESRKLSEQLARTQALRDRLGKVERDLERLAKEGNDEGKPGTGQQTDRPTGDSKPASQSDRSQQNGRSGAQGGSQGDRGAEMQRLREQYARELRQAQDLMDQLRREAAQGSGLGGFTPEGQQMVLSAPGTEAFKQDFAKWGVLRKNVNTALEQLEMSLSKKLQAKQSKDRLAAGAADRAPDAYRTLVDKYFQSLATGRKP